MRTVTTERGDNQPIMPNSIACRGGREGEQRIGKNVTRCSSSVRTTCDMI